MLSGLKGMLPVMTANKTAPKGFTLMEVLVAILLIGVVLVPLFRMQSGSIRLAGTDKFYGTACLLAGKQLAVMENSGFKDLESSGDCGPEYENYQWSCSFSESGFHESQGFDDDGEGQLKKIELEIKDKNSSRAYRIITFRYVYE